VSVLRRERGPSGTRRDARLASRLVGIDVARLVALLGMMATHILDPVDGSSRLAWPQAVAGGRSSALFAVLAGVSLSLMTGRQRPHTGSRRVGDAAGLAARALVIAVVGLWLGQLDTRVAVILVYYAALFLLGLPFLGQSAGTLLALAGWWCVAAPVASHVLRSAWGPQPATVPTTASVDALGATVVDLLLTGYYPAVPWLAYLLAGMAIGRLDLRSSAVATRILVAGCATALTAWGLSWVLTSLPAARAAMLASSPGAASWDEVADRIALGMGGTTPTDTWWWLAVAAPHSATPLDLAHTAGTAATVIGAALLLTRAAQASRWTGVAWATLFGAGAMTLTLYSLHVALLTPGRWPEPTPGNYARHALLALVIGAAFTLAGRRGPLEAVARWASAQARRAVLGPPRPPRSTDAPSAPRSADSAPDSGTP
jgi:uncharacterized membrane protein